MPRCAEYKIIINTFLKYHRSPILNIEVIYATTIPGVVLDEIKLSVHFRRTPRQIKYE